LLVTAHRLEVGDPDLSPARQSVEPVGQ
jgi:hypothetical protein